jgi:hypothetical protein
MEIDYNRKEKYLEILFRSEQSEIIKFNIYNKEGVLIESFMTNSKEGENVMFWYITNPENSYYFKIYQGNNVFEKHIRT